MPDDPNDSLRRFARDLRRVREDRDVSLATVQEATQVHRSHLESFESGTLYEESRMNDVYLKAFVREYAKAVGISPETVIDHLQAALDGAYDDQLLQAFLARPPEEDGSDSASGGDEEDVNSSEQTLASPSSSPESESSQTISRGGDEESADEEDDGFDEPPSDELESADQEEKAASTDRSSPHRDRDDGSRGSLPLPDESEESTEELYRSMSQSRSSGSSDQNSREPTGVASGASFGVRSREGILMAAGLLLLLLVGGGVGLYVVGSGSSSDPASGSVTPGDVTSSGPSNSSPDTTMSDTAEGRTATDRLPPASVSLGDTLHATVVATADVLELRVQQDAKLRRPYWIEKGEAMVFPFTKRITLQNQLENFQLLLEGYPYPTSRTDDEGRVVIRRDTAQQFADTLRGGPSTVPTRPDTVWGDGAGLESDTLDTDTLSTRGSLRFRRAPDTVVHGGSSSSRRAFRIPSMIRLHSL